MNKRQIESWRVTRAKGSVRFVLVNGLLAWGLPMFMIMALITSPFADGLASRAAIVHYITWPMAGILFGVAIWCYSESRYRKAIVG